MSGVMRAFLRLATRLVLFAGLVLLFWFLGPEIWRLLSPFLLAIPVAALLQRPIRFTEKRLHVRHGIASAVWVVVVCAALCALLYWLLSSVINQILQLSGSYQTIVSDLVDLLRGISNRLLDALDYLPAEAEASIRSTLNDVYQWLAQTATRLLSFLLSFALNFASTIPSGLIYLNFLVLGIFFITSGYGGIITRLKALMGKTVRERSELLSGTAGKGLSAYIRVQLLYAVQVLVFSWPALSFFGLPYPFLIALIAAILEFLPIFGNGTLYIPWSVIAYIIGAPTNALQMLILHLVLFITRRLTEPKLMSNQMGLSPLLSLIAMFVGMQLGGVAGLILAPVGAVVIQGAWQAGLFAATMQDIRCVFLHLAGLLREPAPCVTAEDRPLERDATLSSPENKSV